MYLRLPLAALLALTVGCGVDGPELSQQQSAIYGAVNSFSDEKRQNFTAAARLAGVSKNNPATLVVPSFCGAVLLSSNWAITAGHCLKEAGIRKTVWERLGVDSERKFIKLLRVATAVWENGRFKQRLYPVERYTAHFTGSGLHAEFDFALLKLACPSDRKQGDCAADDNHVYPLLGAESGGSDLTRYGIGQVERPSSPGQRPLSVSWMDSLYAQSKARFTSGGYYVGSNQRMPKTPRVRGAPVYGLLSKLEITNDFVDDIFDLESVATYPDLLINHKQDGLVFIHAANTRTGLESSTDLGTLKDSDVGLLCGPQHPPGSEITVGAIRRALNDVTRAMVNPGDSGSGVFASYDTGSRNPSGQPIYDFSYSSNRPILQGLSLAGANAVTPFEDTGEPPKDDTEDYIPKVFQCGQHAPQIALYEQATWVMFQRFNYQVTDWLAVAMDPENKHGFITNLPGDLQNKQFEHVDNSDFDASGKGEALTPGAGPAEEAASGCNIVARQPTASLLTLALLALLYLGRWRSLLRKSE